MWGKLLEKLEKLVLKVTENLCLVCQVINHKTNHILFLFQLTCSPLGCKMVTVHFMQYKLLTFVIHNLYSSQKVLHDRGLESLQAFLENY